MKKIRKIKIPKPQKLRKIKLINNKFKYMLTQPQIDKLNAALLPLVTDADFATVTDISLSVTQTPVVITPTTDILDVPFVH